MNHLQFDKLQFDKNSVMYYFSKNDIIQINHHTVLYHIPYLKRTTWTTFKYGYIGNKLNMPAPHITIISEIVEPEIVESEIVESTNHKKENTWYSIKPIRSKTSLYFQVTFPCLQTLETGIRILLVGTIHPKIIKRNYKLSN